MKHAALIVDDSLTVRMDLKEGFEAAGFPVTTCATLEEAREALGQGAFGVIVLDVVLPDGDGIEFLKELRENPETAELAVLLLSTEVELRERLRGLSTGADDYVGKPYERSYMVQRAREFLATRGVPLPLPGTSPLVLMIDDSATFRSALRAALEGAGYAVEEAGSGEGGLRLAAASRPAAAIVDGMLPGLDGAAVIRRMRSDPALRRTPCLLLTGSGERRDELNALEAGADTYVRKDEDTAIILARLAALLRVSARPAAVEMAGSLFASKKLLAVDDSLTYLEALSTTLRHEGYDVIQARSGEEALALLAVQAVDAILLDMIMPGLSGQETCRRIKVTWRDIPVLMLTAREDREAVIEAFDAGADDYVPKSSEGEVLLARLHAQLRRRQFEEENRKIQEEIQRKELQAAEAKTYRALTEEHLRETETRYRALVETTPAITYTADLSDEVKLLYVSPQTEELLCFGAEEWLGEAARWVKQIHPEDRDRVLEALERTRSGGVPFKMEYRLMTKDGHARWFHDHAVVIADATRNRRTMYGTMVDITGRKQAEEALRQSEQRFARFMQHLPGLAWIKDLKGRYAYANEAAERAFRTPRAELYGKTDDEVFPPETAAQFKENDRSALASETGIQTVETLEHEDGVVHHSLVSKFPISGPNGKVVMVGGVAIDITERKRAEEEIRRLNAELEERVHLRTAELTAANRELEAFSYSVSHDLRAPLRHIHGFSDLLRRQHEAKLDDQGRSYLSKISDSAQQMGVLIDELLTFSRIGRAEPQRTWVDLRELVDEVRDLLQPEMGGRDITWALGELPQVPADRHLLRLVVQNLISNALKYSAPRQRAEISMSTARESGEFVVSIRDNGVGFDMKYAERLFGVFQRLHSDFEGTGIGLATVRRIILRHGGRVWAEGAIDEGACFYFSLPDELPT